MSDIKLFRTEGQNVTELQGQSIGLEKSLQALMEKNLQTFLGVTFLASEYATGKTHRGRIDTLGLDENGFPVIIEYKRSLNENVINQGLFYLDWLMDHQAELKLLVMEKLGKEKAQAIMWHGPRLLCIAGDFTRYDSYAVQQIPRNIELIRYRRYGDELLLLELVNQTTADGEAKPTGSKTPGVAPYKTVTEYLEGADAKLKALHETAHDFTMALGDDITVTTLKYYLAYRRIKNFVCLEVQPKTGTVVLYLKVDPRSVTLKKDFTRDVSQLGHLGTGDLEVRVRSQEDFSEAKALIQRSYEES